MASVVEGDRRQIQAPTSKESTDLDVISEDQRLASADLLSESIEQFLLVIEYYRDQFRERDYLTIFFLSQTLKNGVISPLWASVVLLQLACLRQLSISQRRMKTINFKSQDCHCQYIQVMSDFSKLTLAAMNDVQWREAIQENSVESNVEDLIDGRLLKAIFHAVHNGQVASLNLGSILVDSKLLSSALNTLIPFDLSLKDPGTLETEMDDNEPLPSSKRSILAFSNPIVDRHLGSICISVDVSSSEEHEQSLTVPSREISHWHNSKRSLDQKKPVVISKPLSRRWNPLRSNQMYMTEMTAYAASLTNTKGKILTPETISLSAAAIGSSRTSSAGRGQQRKEELKATSSKMADRIRAENKAKRENIEESKAFAAWNEIRKRTDKLEPEVRYLDICKYFSNLDEIRAETLLVDVKMYCIQALVEHWATFCKSNRREEGYNVAALIWDTIRCLGSPGVVISKVAAANIDSVCSSLGISKPAEFPNLSDHPLSFNFQLPRKSTLSIDIPSREFQLLHCGPYMDRNTDAKQDPRVPTFQPDGWQRHVLDELDANNSIFVVAPTSAGKTFISFYAMEKALRESNEGVLVYVAPTKALVNQITAEIHGRFKKTYPHAGHSVWAIHTRDYRVNNPSGCQILVTVPHILQIVRSPHLLLCRKSC